MQSPAAWRHYVTWPAQPEVVSYVVQRMLAGWSLYRVLLINEGRRAVKMWFHNKINAATILQALVGLLQHALILFYFIAHETTPSAIASDISSCDTVSEQSYCEVARYRYSLCSSFNTSSRRGECVFWKWYEIWFGRRLFSSVSRFYTNLTFTVSPWQGRRHWFKGGRVQFHERSGRKKSGSKSIQFECSDWGWGLILRQVESKRNCTEAE